MKKGARRALVVSDSGRLRTFALPCRRRAWAVSPQASPLLGEASAVAGYRHQAECFRYVSGYGLFGASEIHALFVVCRCFEGKGASWRNGPPEAWLLCCRPDSPSWLCAFLAPHGPLPPPMTPRWQTMELSVGSKHAVHQGCWDKCCDAAFFGGTESLLCTAKLGCHRHVTQPCGSLSQCLVSTYKASVPFPLYN